MQILKEAILKDIIDKGFLVEENKITYFPNNKSFIYVMNIELNIVKQESLTRDLIEREYICSKEEGLIFLKKGLNVAEACVITVEDNSIIVDFNFKELKLKEIEENIELIETGVKNNYTLEFNFETLELLKSNKPIGVDLYFSDNIYNFWKILNTLILEKFNNLGINVLDKINSLKYRYELQCTKVNSMPIPDSSLESVEELFLLNQYYVDSKNKYNEAFKLKWDSFDKSLLKLNPPELIEAFGLEVSTFTMKVVKKNIVNLFLVKELTNLNFNKKEISILLSKKAISLEILKTNLFNVYLNKLSKKDIIRKLTKNSNSIDLILDIEPLINSLGLNYEDINANLSLEKLEKKLLEKFYSIEENADVVEGKTIREALFYKIHAEDIKKVKFERDLLINNLLDLNFKLNEIDLLIKKGVCQDTLKSEVFKYYCENLSSEGTLNRFKGVEYIPNLITFIEKNLKTGFIKKADLLRGESISELESIILNDLNNKVVANVNNIIKYPLPNIDYSKKEQLIYSSDEYSLYLPLNTSMFREYGLKLSNCIGINYKRFLSNFYNVIVIKQNDSSQNIIGAIKIDEEFENLLEAKGFNNDNLYGSAMDFIVKFCKENEIEYESYFKKEKRVI